MTMVSFPQPLKPALLKNDGGDHAMKPEGKPESMMNAAGLIVTTPTDREIVMTRVFNAPQAGLPRLDQAGTGEALVAWAAGLDHAGMRN